MQPSLQACIEVEQAQLPAVMQGWGLTSRRSIPGNYTALRTLPCLLCQVCQAKHVQRVPSILCTLPQVAYLTWDVLSPLPAFVVCV